MTSHPDRPAALRRLVLTDGSEYNGQALGASGEVAGEVVFHTGMVGYVEALTDPSYRGQILVLTYPPQGNYGVPAAPYESAEIQVQGLVVARYTAVPSHPLSLRSLDEWLRAAGVPALTGVDTRAVTLRLREHGTMPGALLDAGPAIGTSPQALSRVARSVDMENVWRLVEPTALREYPGPGPRLLIIDTGAKESILRALLARGAHLVRAPASAAWEPLLDGVDGVVLTNGPGDPELLQPLCVRLRQVLARGLPTLGICLGHQLLARAAGAQTYKLPYGHRSHNQPVQELMTGRAFVTSQNHGYAVRESSLPSDWEPWFRNLNDGTNEGIRHRTQPFCSVQFHPEAAAGPNDSAMLFDDFLRMVGQVKGGRR